MNKLNARHIRVVEMVKEVRENQRYLTKDEMETLLGDCKALFTPEVVQLVDVLMQQLQACHEERERVQRLLDGAR